MSVQRLQDVDSELLPEAARSQDGVEIYAATKAKEFPDIMFDPDDIPGNSCDIFLCPPTSEGHKSANT